MPHFYLPYSGGKFPIVSNAYLDAGEMKMVNKSGLELKLASKQLESLPENAIFAIKLDKKQTPETKIVMNEAEFLTSDKPEAKRSYLQILSNASLELKEVEYVARSRLELDEMARRLWENPPRNFKETIFVIKAAEKSTPM